MAQTNQQLPNDRQVAHFEAPGHLVEADGFQDRYVRHDGVDRVERRERLIGKHAVHGGGSFADFCGSRFVPDRHVASRSLLLVVAHVPNRLDSFRHTAELCVELGSRQADLELVCVRLRSHYLREYRQELVDTHNKKLDALARVLTTRHLIAQSPFNLLKRFLHAPNLWFSNMLFIVVIFLWWVLFILCVYALGLASALLCLVGFLYCALRCLLGLRAYLVVRDFVVGDFVVCVQDWFACFNFGQLGWCWVVEVVAFELAFLVDQVRDDAFKVGHDWHQSKVTRFSIQVNYYEFGKLVITFNKSDQRKRFRLCVYQNN